ncbi:9777_t:CDS:2 [Funneliformis geosporum]|nr:9777_t:CDS:2 [Funneliformis geosporum]
MATMVHVNKLLTPAYSTIPFYDGFNALAVSNKMREKMTGKYREVMVGTNQDALRSLMNEKFSIMDTADTYEKRITTYAHMSQYMEMRLRQANPVNLDAFFTNLRQIWLECRGRIAEQAPPPS